MLACYPEIVVERVCDPIRGLPAKNKFLPAIAEIREFCEREMIWHDAVERRVMARRHTAQVLAKLEPPATPIDRHLVRAEADKLLAELGGATKVEITLRKPRDAREATVAASHYTAKLDELAAEYSARPIVVSRELVKSPPPDDEPDF